MLTFILVLPVLIISVTSEKSIAAEQYPPVIHQGSLDLTYFGLIERDPPLAPMQKVRANNKFFYVLPDVVAPSIQSIFLLENTTINFGEDVLDIGAGSGIQAIFAAQKANFVQLVS